MQKMYSMARRVVEIVTAASPTTSSVTATAPDPECETSILYQTCLRVCRTVAVSVSSNDVCAEPYSYDNTSFRKLLVCQPQIIYFPESDVGSDAFIGSDTVIA